ncbi:MAG: DJ-1/PfpI family protein [Gammaproteobacteria bacterium]|nr:DJ-1/PfpI family protein [Gammaproteobacteria bacterium]
MASVLIPLATGFEELEAVTIIDLLRRAGVEVTVAGIEGPDAVTGSRGTRILPDVDLDEVVEQTFDMITLPGGLPGADNLNADPRIHTLLKRMASEGRYTTAICAAPKVLGNAGLLDDKRATSFPGHLEALERNAIHIVNEPVVMDGKVITSRGPGTAMDFALSLIEELCGKPTRDEVEAPLQRP